MPNEARDGGMSDCKAAFEPAQLPSGEVFSGYRIAILSSEREFFGIAPH